MKVAKWGATKKRISKLTRWTEKQTNRQIDKHKQMDRQIRWTEKQINKEANETINKLMGRIRETACPLQVSIFYIFCLFVLASANKKSSF
jgi:hypothetical protein